MAEICSVSPRSDYADACRSYLTGEAESCCVLLGDDIAGFALVAWDRRGECRSALWTEEGPVGLALAPSYVGDALNRHVAVHLSQTAEAEVPDA